MEVVLLVIFITILIGIFIYILVEDSRHRDIKNANDSYQLALTSLRDDPTNTTLQEQAWSLGRIYVATTQNVKGVIPFTEEMLANDVETIIANAPPKPAPAKKDKGTPTVLSLDDRINALIQMRDSNLLSNTEFEQKRKEILDSI
jgi:preprotein translocase subunit SecG